MPSLCCPKKSADCKCAEHEIMETDANGCNTCNCLPGPCGKGVMPDEDSYCSADEPCRGEGHTCQPYKGSFGGEYSVCCPPKEEFQCRATDMHVIAGDGSDKCCPQVACRMYCPLGWAWENDCPKCGCFTPEDTCTVSGGEMLPAHRAPIPYSSEVTCGCDGMKHFTPSKFISSFTCPHLSPFIHLSSFSRSHVPPHSFVLFLSGCL